MTGSLYDDPEFLAGYSRLPRSVLGLDGAPEWGALRALLPGIAGKRIVDLGCGFGWFCRWAADQGAATVLGVDGSVRVLERAMAETTVATIEYRHEDLEQLTLPAGTADLVYSSLTLHYLADLAALLRAVFDALVPGGTFVFSVEHPIFSAPSEPRFVDPGDGTRAWLVDNYLVEGPRSTHWFVDGVVKYHRTIGTQVNGLVGAGFEIVHLEEWGPTDAQVFEVPEWADERHRPAFLLVRVRRP